MNIVIPPETNISDVTSLQILKFPQNVLHRPFQMENMCSRETNVPYHESSLISKFPRNNLEGDFSIEAILSEGGFRNTFYTTIFQAASSPFSSFFFPSCKCTGSLPSRCSDFQSQTSFQILNLTTVLQMCIFCTESLISSELRWYSSQEQMFHAPNFFVRSRSRNFPNSSLQTCLYAELALSKDQVFTKNKQILPNFSKH